MKPENFLLLILGIVTFGCAFAIGIVMFEESENLKNEQKISNIEDIEIEVGDLFIKEQFDMYSLILSDVSGRKYNVKNHNNIWSYFVTTKYDKGIEKIIKIERASRSIY